MSVVLGLRPRVLAKGLTTLATIAACGWLIKVSGIEGALDTHWIDSAVRGQGLRGELLFLGLGALVTAAGLPRQAVSFLGGYAFGFFGGTALSLLASVLGCVSAFFWARLLGRGTIQRRFPDRIRRLDAFLHDNAFTTTLLIRLLPVGSNLLTNLVGGVTSVRPLPFFLGSAVGYLPQTLIFVLLGMGVDLGDRTTTIASIVLFVLSTLLGAWLFRRYRSNRAADQDYADVLDGR